MTMLCSNASKRAICELAHDLDIHVPNDDRVVIIVQSGEAGIAEDKGKVLAVAARYKDGKWIGECTGKELPVIAEHTVWIESPY